MAARATRSASGKARLTEAVATGPLGALSHDELGVIVDGLADPLQPVVAVALSSTCLGLRTPLRPALEVLKERHARVLALCRDFVTKGGVPLSVSEFSCTESVLAWPGTRPSAEHMATLGMLLSTIGLPKLKFLYLGGSRFGNVGMRRLCEGLGEGMGDCTAPSLLGFALNSNNLWPTGAEP